MKLKKIDFESGRFESCGVQYTIDVGGMCYDRMVKFLEWMPYVAIGMNGMDLMLFIKQCFDKLTSGGEDFKKSFFEVSQMMFNMIQTADKSTEEEHLLKNLDYYLKFCALFVVTDDEDMTVFNAKHNERKIENWKKDMDMVDFFFLAKKRVPFLQATLKEIYEQTNQPEVTK